MPRYSPRTGQLTEYQVGPFDAAHLYLQWGGSLPGNEQWSCGMRLAALGGGGGSAADGATMLSAVAGAVNSYHNGGPSAGSQAKLQYVKLNHVGTDGHYTLESTNEQIMADVSGGGGSSPYPNQVCWVVSFTTGVSRGPAHRGRIYCPLPAAVVGGDGLIPAASRDALKTSTDLFLSNLNAVNANWDPAVFSRKAGAPAHRLITGVEVGRVLDTQRRRRRSLPESYT